MEKKIPRATVIPSEMKQEPTEPDFKEEWDQVTVAPEESKTTVFKRGIWKADNERTPGGGQIEPNSTLGDKEQCRYAQKNPMKKKTSETINRPIPSRKPSWTRLVWNPKEVDSRTTLDHQKRQDIARSTKPR